MIKITNTLNGKSLETDLVFSQDQLIFLFEEEQIKCELTECKISYLSEKEIILRFKHYSLDITDQEIVNKIFPRLSQRKKSRNRKAIMATIALAAFVLLSINVIGDNAYHLFSDSYIESESQKYLNQISHQNCKMRPIYEVEFKKFGRDHFDSYPMIIQSKEVNAFALPPNYILFTTGFLDQLESPEELLAVWAHEKGHHVHKHSQRIMAKTIIYSVLASLLSRNNDSMIFTLIHNKLYSQPLEQEADDYSIEFLNKHQVSTFGGANFFRKLKEDKSHDWLYYLSFSHPKNDVRIENYDSNKQYEQSVDSPFYQEAKLIYSYLKEHDCQ